MKVLVTGGAGFIGSHIVRALVDNGDRVWVIDDYSTGNPDNLETVRSRIKMVEGDLRDPEVVGPVVSEVEAVLHQGALPSVPRSFSDPVGTTSVNAGGTLNLLEAARGSDVKTFVIASSSSIYGDVKALIKSEDLPPEPLSPYAVSKLAGEYYCRLYHKLYHLPTFALRYFNVFGPGQDPNSQYSAVIPLFSTAILDGRTPVIY
ncbi:MAG TPA: NAD-dependent epimerase/dehydratase family protein, partial [Proteobacteria bacterium]|nr:NAD-dependent epimerase/dehydratase family protein [Pseudomonadota bacterium]